MEYGNTINDELGAIAPETKERQHDSGDLTAAFDTFMLSFNEFKATNDQRLSELEQRNSSDCLLEDKLRRLEKQFDVEISRMRRPPIGQPLNASEVKAALDLYIRKGQTDALFALERKGLSVGSEADGGFLVAPETETRLFTSLKEQSPVRALASQITVSAPIYKRPYVISGAAAGWVAETGLRAETTAPRLAEASFPAMELYAMPAATKQLLDDSLVNVETWLVDEVRDAFSTQETAAFISGDGQGKPRGILDYPRSPAPSAGFGTVGTVATGTAGAFDPDTPADALMALVHSLRASHRRNSTFLMNRPTLSAVRRLTNADGEYLWQPRLGDGLENRLLGFPVVEVDDMPDIAPGAPAIAFGDLKRAYLIVDRQGVQVLRDPFSAKPYVLFYATKRVGGGMAEFDALRVLVFAAS